jgi:Zn-dependent metalloprotease
VRFTQYAIRSTSEALPWRRTLAWAAIVLLLLAALALGRAAAAPPGGAPDQVSPCSHIELDAETGYARTLRDCGPAPNPGDAVEVARQFLRQHRAELGLSADLSDLETLAVRHGLASSHVWFQQTYGGLPVYQALTSVHLGQKQVVQVVHNRYRRVTGPLPPVSIDRARAESVARQAAGMKIDRGAATARQVVYIDDGWPVRAWELTLPASEPLGDWHVLVDAATGRVIKVENLIVFDTGSGRVFNPNPVQSSGDTTLRDNNNTNQPALTAELQTVTLQGLDASGRLRGQYVDLTALTGGYKPAGQANEPSHVYNYDRADDRFEEVEVYWALDSVQRYFHSLDFSNANTPPNGIRDFSTLAHAHWYGEDQSFYSTYDDAVHFGDGGVDDAEDADIIIHEYGHAVQYNQNPAWGGGEMGAMGEGFGDYLAASFYAGAGDATYQAAHAACVGEWDGTAYSPLIPPCLRRVDGNKHYPDDLTGEVHDDGEIWSRALWDIRAALGGQVADRLVLESHFSLASSSTMPDGAQAILDADQNLYGGAHRTAIAQAFAARGILSSEPLVAPVLTYPAGGETLTAGQPITVLWTPSPGSGNQYELAFAPNCSLVQDLNDGFEGTGLDPIYTGGGDRPWLIDATRAHTGIHAARSGSIGDNQSSSLILQANVAATGSLHFWYQVSSEKGYDFFDFYLDETRLVHVSGIRGWSELTAPIAAGDHTLIWRYSKDVSLKAGLDAAWIDDLSLPQLSRVTWTQIVGLTSPDVTGYDWTLPATATDDACFRLRAHNGPALSDWARSGVFRLVSGLLADFDHDGKVTARDILDLASRWGTVDSGGPGFPHQFDLVPDGVINSLDIEAAKASWRTTGP